MKKNLMRILAIAAIVLVAFTGCNEQKTKTDKRPATTETAQAENIEVIYFHFSRRCTTCKAVESVAEKAVAKLYPEEVKNGKVSFESVNLDLEEGKKTGEKYNVHSQSLIIFAGDKKTDVTTQAFLHATSNPFKLRKSIQEVIDVYL